MRADTFLACFVSLAPLTGVLAGDEQSPPLPSAVVDLRSRAGLAEVSGRWRFTEASIVDADNFAPGPDNKPTGERLRTHDISPRINTPAFDAADWQEIAPDSLEARRSAGKLSLAWYGLDFKVPDHINDLSTNDSTLVLELTVDDYAEVWVNNSLSTVLGQSGGQLIGGWNTPTRVTLTSSAKPGEEFHVAIFAANGPLSDPPSNYIWVRSATLDIYTHGVAAGNAPTPVETRITRLDPALDRVVAPGAVAEKLAGGFAFTEGPVWVPALTHGKTYGGGGTGGYLLFSDPNKNVIHRFDPGTGAVSIFRTKSGYTGLDAGNIGRNIGEYHQPGSNGLTLSPDGRLTICEHGNRRVTRLEPNGSITVLADNHDGHRLNSPNDLVYRSDGALFFTDPPFGLPKVFDDPRKELDHSGVYCVYNGSVRLLSTDLAGPNGLAFSPDEKHLYVDNWDEHKKVVLRYDVAADGSLSNAVTFVDLTKSLPGELCFDGLKVDALGNVLVSSPDGVRIYSPAAAHLGTIALPELPANFTFGDADRKTLYMTARTGLYRIRLNTPGAR